MFSSHSPFRFCLSLQHTAHAPPPLFFAPCPQPACVLPAACSLCSQSTSQPAPRPAEQQGMGRQMDTLGGIAAVWSDKGSGSATGGFNSRSAERALACALRGRAVLAPLLRLRGLGCRLPEPEQQRGDVPPETGKCQPMNSPHNQATLDRDRQFIKEFNHGGRELCDNNRAFFSLSFSFFLFLSLSLSFSLSLSLSLSHTHTHTHTHTHSLCFFLSFSPLASHSSVALCPLMKNRPLISLKACSAVGPVREAHEDTASAAVSLVSASVHTHTLHCEHGQGGSAEHEDRRKGLGQLTDCGDVCSA